MVALPPLGGGLGAWHRRFVALFHGATHSAPSSAHTSAPSTPLPRSREHSPVPPVKKSADKTQGLRAQHPRDHPRPATAPPLRANTPINSVYDFGRDDGPDTRFNFRFEVLKTYGVEVARDYIVLPDDVIINADSQKPNLLAFRFDDNSFLFDLTFQVPITQFMPPPDSRAPVSWHSNKTLALTAFIGHGDYHAEP